MAEIRTRPAPRRRGASWRHIAYDVAVPAGLTGRDALVAELRAWQRHLPASAVFTGLTAAAVHGLWLPGPIDALPHFVAMGTVQGEVKPIRRGLRISRHPAPPACVTVDGLRVATVGETLLACARVLGPLDLVILTDAALHLEKCGAADIASAAGHRRKGAPALRAALALADGRSESAWETILRLLHQVLGVSVTPQVNLHDARGGFLGRVDLLLDGTTACHEYDGAGHREPVQHRKDLKRERKLLNGDYTRRGYTSDVLLRNPASVLEDCERALGRRLSRAALLQWHRLLADSLLTRSGQQRLAARLCS